MVANGVAVVHQERPRAIAQDRTINVVHVVFDFHGGGMESLVAAMARRFAGSDVRMSVITLSGRAGRLGAATRPHLRDYCVLEQIPGLSMVAPIALTRALRAAGSQVVHLHSGSWYKGSLAAKRADVSRVIYTEHGREHHDPALARTLDRRAARRTHVTVTVSDRLNRYVQEKLGVDRSRLCTIPNGVDTEGFSPGAPPTRLRDSLEIPYDALVIGSVGRLEPVKAYDRLIDAVAQLRDTGRLERPVVLVIFGEGSARAALKGRVHRLGLDDAVRLPGWTDEPAAMYRLFDVFAMTSVSEGASVSLIEAMACGVAPVVTDAGSNAAVLGAGLRDQVVPIGDRSALVRSLGDTLESEPRREKAGAIVRQRAVERFGLGAMIDAYERLYRGESPAAVGTRQTAPVEGRFREDNESECPPRRAGPG